MAMSSIGKPVVIDKSNMRRFAEVAKKPKRVLEGNNGLKWTKRPPAPKKKG